MRFNTPLFCFFFKISLNSVRKSVDMVSLLFCVIVKLENVIKLGRFPLSICLSERLSPPDKRVRRA